MNRIKLIAIFMLSISILNAQNKTITLAHNGNSTELTKEIAQYLKTKLNTPVKVIELNKITDMTNALKTKKVDLAFMGTFGYILAKSALESQINPLVVYGKNGIPGSYTSSIITYRSSDIKSINDIKTNAKNAKFVLAKPTSASGHIVPRLFLQTREIESMEKSFSSVTFAGGHDKVIAKITSKQAQLGAIATGYLANAIKNGKVNSKDIAVLWTSGPIVDGPVVANSSLSNAEKEQIKNIFINLPTDNPVLWGKIISTYPSAKQSGGYIIGNDDYYNPIRKLISHIDNLKLILQYYLKTKF
ncbi:MAG: phosphate/phosphite/phosphonate ABC transporter substrate-binding protein [Bacteroidales bacterium]|nr:phosphate/phosphite/phosphonate ABC transporter substrate-binding protein [Bacteroidales bacterium]